MVWDIQSNASAVRQGKKKAWLFFFNAQQVHNVKLMSMCWKGVIRTSGNIKMMTVQLQIRLILALIKLFIRDVYPVDRKPHRLLVLYENHWAVFADGRLTY